MTRNRLYPSGRPLFEGYGKAIFSINSPSLLSYGMDVVIAGVIAWSVPYLAALVQDNFHIDLTLFDRPEIRVVAFFLTFLLLYGIQVTKWAHRVIAEIAIDMPDIIASRTVETTNALISKAVPESVAGVLLGAARDNTSLAQLHTQIIHGYVSRLQSLPLWMSPLAAKTAQFHMDKWIHELRQIQNVGLEIDLGDQIDTVRRLVEQCKSYLLIDPIIYGDVKKDWTPVWHDFLAWIKEQKYIRKDYVITVEHVSLTPTEMVAYRNLVDFLQKVNFTVWVCPPSLILDVNPDTPFLKQLIHVVDERYYVSMPQTDTFTGSRKILTTVNEADSRLTRFIANVKQYRTRAAVEPGGRSVGVRRSPARAEITRNDA